MQIKVYIVNAFTNKKNGGNPAGVVVSDTVTVLTEGMMQQIAKKVGLSETAFVQESAVADFKVRFFTPTEEVELCGHATIATFSLLHELGRIDTGEFFQETKAGVLSVQVDEHGNVFMEQNRPNFFEVIDEKEIYSCLNMKEGELMEELPIQIVSTGLRDIIVPIKNKNIINNLQPDYEKIKELSRKYKSVGIHAFTLDTYHEQATAYTRNFAPLYGINEESATGTANGALSCYLFHYQQVSGMEASKMSFEQGYMLKRESKIHVKLDIDDKMIKKVQVGGTAIKAEEELLEI